MTPLEGDPEDRPKHADESGTHNLWLPRATRHQLRLPFRYRLEGQQDWRPGETINISKSGLLFCSNEVLEVDAKVEIIFQTSGIALLKSSTRRALVVRRMLSNWPETRPVFAARFGD